MFVDDYTAAQDPDKLHILSGDLLTVDVLIPLPSQQTLEAMPGSSHTREKYKELNTVLDAILAAKGAKRGEKVLLNDDEYEMLSQLVSAGMPTDGIVPGGSAVNTLVTMSSLLGRHNLAIDFLGVVGNRTHSEKIWEDIKKARIHVIPGNAEDAVSALSLVFTEENGERTIAKHPGNARDHVTADLITYDLMKRSDVVFVQGSIWEKFTKDVAQKLVDQCKAHKKKLWLALPTQTEFNEMSKEGYRALIEDADIVLGNEEELMRVYETEHLHQNPDGSDDTERNFQAALEKLQEALDKPGANNGHKKKIAFITWGSKGAVVLERGKQPHRVFTAPTSGTPNKVGAGDSSYAGFLAGITTGMSGLDAAQAGMEVAAAKLLSPGARISNVKQALHKLKKVSYTIADNAQREEDYVSAAHSPSAEPISHAAQPLRDRKETSPSLTDVILRKGKYTKRSSMDRMADEHEDHPRGLS